MKIENIENRNGNKNQTNGVNPLGLPIQQTNELLNSALRIPHSALPSRNGKIARLPLEIREYVNELLRSNHTYAHISDELAKAGHPNLSAANISHWKHGGYIDWLREQQQLETRLALAKALENCTRSADVHRLQQNAIALAADQLSLIMLNFDAQRALAVLSQRPELFPKFVAALDTLSRCTTNLAKSLDLTQDRATILRDQLRAADTPHSESPSEDQRLELPATDGRSPSPRGEGRSEGESCGKETVPVGREGAVSSIPSQRDHQEQIVLAASASEPRFEIPDPVPPGSAGVPAGTPSALAVQPNSTNLSQIKPAPGTGTNNTSAKP